MYKNSPETTYKNKAALEHDIQWKYMQKTDKYLQVCANHVQYTTRQDTSCYKARVHKLQVAACKV